MQLANEDLGQCVGWKVGKEWNPGAPQNVRLWAEKKLENVTEMWPERRIEDKEKVGAGSQNKK